MIYTICFLIVHGQYVSNTRPLPSGLLDWALAKDSCAAESSTDILVSITGMWYEEKCGNSLCVFATGLAWKDCLLHCALFKKRSRNLTQGDLSTKWWKICVFLHSCFTLVVIHPRTARRGSIFHSFVWQIILWHTRVLCLLCWKKNSCESKHLIARADCTLPTITWSGQRFKNQHGIHVKGRRPSTQLLWKLLELQLN